MTPLRDTVRGEALSAVAQDVDPATDRPTTS